MIAQVALSFVMLTSAGLLASSLGNLEGQRLGLIRRPHVARIDVPPQGATPETLSLLFARLRERVAGITGVRNVSYALSSPMDGNNWSSGISIGGRAADQDQSQGASWNRVGPSLLRDRRHARASWPRI